MSDIADTRPIKTSLGSARVVKRLEILDENPAVLACGEPVFLEDEIAAMPTKPPAERARAWQRRVVDLEEYRRRKAADPAMTVATPW